MQSFFFDVPEGVAALRLDLEWKERAVAMAVVRPDTRYHRAGMVEGGGSGITQVVTDPMPGTWEVRLADIADTQTFDWEQAKKKEPVPPTPATLTVSALATEISVVRDGRPVADNGADQAAGTHQVWIANRMAEFTGAVVSTPVGSAHRTKRSIQPREQHMYEVEVLPGSSALVVRTTEPEGVDLDVFVFDCTGDECSAAQVDGDPVGQESVTISNPAAGTWKIVVDGAAVPAEGAVYDYLDVVFNPVYGMVSTVDVPQERARDARWMATAHSWVAPAAHADGREPYLAVQVEGKRSDAGFLVSVGEVGSGGGE